MNKSSFLSQNSEKNTSSFLNDSINTTKQCCQYKEKYELLYKEMSSIRIQLRSNKQQNNSLRATLKGTQQENSTLKSLLSTKKQLINRLNYQIRESNDEINRLQDYNHILMNSNEEFLTKNTELQEKIKDFQRKLIEEGNISLEYKQKMQEKQRQIMKNKQYYEGMQKMYKQQSGKNLQDIGRVLNEQIQSIFDIFMSSNINNQQMSIKPLQQKTQKTSFHQSYHLREQIKNTVLSSSLKYQPQANSKLNRQKNLQTISNSLNLNTLQSKLSTFNKQIQQKHLQREQLIENQQSQIKSHKVKISHLQNQLQESIQMFQQQLNDIHALKGKLKQRQMILVQNQKVTVQKNTEKQQFLRYVNKKMIYILQNTVVHDNIDVFTKLNTIIQDSNAKKFELQVLLRQIQTIAQHNFKQTIKVSLKDNHLQTLTRQYNQISEEYELISLKYSTLQRQYNQILEDNHRLIKFNHLSKFRLNRNTLSPSKEQDNQHLLLQNNKTPVHHLKSQMMSPRLIQNKQNLQSTVNK